MNLTNNKIESNILKAKEQEKDNIRLNLKNLTTEQRKIETEMKKHKLGRWSFGKSRAVFEYDANQYDKERDEIEKTALMELKLGIRDEITEFNSEIYELSMIDSDSLEIMEQQEVQKQIDSEVFNLSAIPEDGEEDDDSVDYM